MSKRPGKFDLNGALAKREKTDNVSRKAGGGGGVGQGHRNPYLTQPAKPTSAISTFLLHSRTAARRLAKTKNMALPLKQPIVEVEARLGTLKSNFGLREMRVTSSGAKTLPDADGKQHMFHAFLCNHTNESGSALNNGRQPAPFEGGVTRSHFTRWTAAGLSEPSPISQAFNVRSGNSASSSGEAAQIKKDLAEVEMVETVYGGYPNSRRVAFPGVHPPAGGGHAKPGRMEKKAKLETFDVTLPAANYDIRLSLSSETIDDDRVVEPPPGWSKKRLKRRRSYMRRDHSFAWQLDVTEVSTEASANADDGEEASPILYEVEMELSQSNTLKLVNADDEAASKLAMQLAQQLWWMLGQINPLSDVLEVDSYVREHPDREAVQHALDHCFSLKKYMDSKEWSPAITPEGPTYGSRSPRHFKFIGCMPVNFSRHNIEEIQRCERGYYLSEKTDGVRYLMIFTGSTVVLVDRAMKGNQPTFLSGKKNGDGEPMAHVIPLIQAGTVLDGEIVIHRKLRRPVFVVFDVMCCGNTPVLQQPFEERLNHLRKATFRTPTADRDMFAASLVKDESIPLPLLRKQFVRRTELDSLLSNVIEERGARMYRNGETYNHLTDGIIFQPNRPYRLGTDMHLLKWKYLDTVTIDVELLPPRNGMSEDTLRVGCLGDEGTMVDMTRYVKLPPSERLRLEADRQETGAKIAEVGFDPETGEWYYLTMRPDKIASNHISTVLGTLLELAESLGTNELRYRMSVRGGRDTYRKDVRSMQKQLLDHQRKKNAGR